MQRVVVQGQHQSILYLKKKSFRQKLKDVIYVCGATYLDQVPKL